MGHPSDRPTAPPSFDVASYARQVEADDPDSHVRFATSTDVAAAAISDEAWGASAQGALVVVLSPAVLRNLPLDHRAGFLLAQMDGMTDLESILAIVPLPRPEALRILRDLFECGVVELRT